MTTEEFWNKYFNEHSQDVSKVSEAFSLYIAGPILDCDKYLLMFKKLLFYQQTELLNLAILQNYDIVTVSVGLKYGAITDLVMFKFYMALQEVFEDKNESFDRAKYASKMSKYDFEFNIDFLSSIEECFFKPQLSNEKISTMFIDNKVKSIFILRGYFLRYMYEKGFEFYLSGKIWAEMYGLWEMKNKEQTTLAAYCSVPPSYDTYLTGFSDDFVDQKSTIITAIWGSVYVYEFLYKFNFISTEIFQSFMKMSPQVKGHLIGLFTPDLWKSNFVHHWQKPESISDIEFKEEGNIFKKSISFKYENFDEIRSNMSEELSKIGVLADYIIEGGQKVLRQDKGSMLDRLYDCETYTDDYLMHAASENDSCEPIRVGEKPGRNDPCLCGSGKA